MKHHITVKLTVEQLETTITALRLELERNYGGDAAVVNQLKSALDAMTAWKWEDDKRRK